MYHKLYDRQALYQKAKQTVENEISDFVVLLLFRLCTSHSHCLFSNVRVRNHYECFYVSEIMKNVVSAGIAIDDYDKFWILVKPRARRIDV